LQTEDGVGSRWHWSAASDPLWALRLLHIGRSGKPGFYELEFCEAAVGELTLAARSGHRSISRIAVIHQQGCMAP
jgi:hypothetical protein